MSIKVRDVVRVNCRVSRYNGVEGEVFHIEEKSQYAIVDMPKGTELQMEGIEQNRIIEGMKQAEKKRKKPLARWPKGDPQWFPLEWLVVVVGAEDSTSEELELAIDD